MVVAGGLAPEVELRILRDVDALRDQHIELEALCAALADYLARLVDADSVSFAVVLEGLWYPVGVAPADLLAALDALAVRYPESEAESERPSGMWQMFRHGRVHVFPMRPSRRTLGAVLIDRTDRIDLDEAALGRIAAFTMQADSALAHALVFRDLADRNAELSAIYAIDHIRDTHGREGDSFETMLQAVMDHVLVAIPAGTAVVGVANVTDTDTTLRLLQARDSDAFDAPTARAVHALMQDAFHARELIRRDHVGRFAGSLCMPLILNEDIIGGFALLGADFQRRDERILGAICSQVDTAIFEDLARQRIKTVFKRYVSDRVVDEMLRQRGTDFLRGVRRQVTVIFSDLRGFTSVSESLEVGLLVDMLNEHLAAMTEVVFRHDGTVDKFIGDCVMAFWGAPVSNDDHAFDAVRAAVEMRAVHNRLREKWLARGLPAPRIGIGVNSGEVMVGNIGSTQLSSYTIIGDHVNLAARMESLSGGDDILITQHTLDRLGDRARVASRGEVIVKGKTVPVRTYNVIELVVPQPSAVDLRTPD